MEAWQEKRSIQNMNLRSVFSAEQQEVLERYYENGMTNQSKSCFQMILQCAQETKLDFSVVRTWVGNKRRKLASKVEQNGVMTHGLPGHSLVGASGGALVAGMALTPEMVAARSVQRGPAVTHLLPPVSASSSSPSPSSCSPHSGGSGHSGGGNSNDVIVTGIYSLSRASTRPELSSSHARTAAKAPPPSRTEAELPVQIHVRPTVRTDSPPLHAMAVALPRRALPHGTASGPAQFGKVRRSFPPAEPAGVPRSWARQYGPPKSQPWPPKSQPWPFPSSQTQTQTQSQSLPAPAGTSAHAGPQSGVTDPGVRIQQVFTLAAFSDGQYRPSSGGGSKPRPPVKTRTPDVTGCFSIAMETGDADDEYAREEELANMGAQVQACPVGGRGSGGAGGVGEISGATGTGHGGPRRDSAGMGRNLAGANPPNSDHFEGKGYQMSPSSSHCPPRHSSYYSGTASRGSYPLRMPFQGPGHTMPNLQQASDALCAPWITSNSRKRTLQDRTQFSDRDLLTLKRYWDNGMTSLGSVCREKISAASTELGVDSEIVKTWIGNRRRKYRLMGIEIPPPKGGPAVFSSQLEAESPRCLTPDVDGVVTPEPGEDGERMDEVSICLSEDGGSDTYQREGSGDGDGETTNVKIEIIDDEEEEEEDGDISGSDMEHMQNLLEFKHEEVRYLESELENQKQKYQELQNFARNLLTAVRNHDKEKQQELLASLPQEVEEDCEMSPEMGEDPDVSAITIQSVSPAPEEMGEQAPL